jgi:hypothetical protein
LGGEFNQRNESGSWHWVSVSIRVRAPIASLGGSELLLGSIRRVRKVPPVCRVEVECDINKVEETGKTGPRSCCGGISR